MYYIHNVCCLCLQNTKDLKKLAGDSKDSQENCYKKLKIFLLPKIYEESVISNQTLICNKCCDSVEEMHIFREKCIKNINLFKSYIRQLRTYSKLTGTIDIQLMRCDQPAWNPNYVVPLKPRFSAKITPRKHLNNCKMRLYGTPKFDGKLNHIESSFDDDSYHESFENDENHEEIMEEIYRVNFENHKMFEIEENYDIGEKYNQIFSSQQEEIINETVKIEIKEENIETTSTNNDTQSYVPDVSYNTNNFKSEYIPYQQNYQQNSSLNTPNIRKSTDSNLTSEMSSPGIENHDFSPQKHRNSTDSLPGNFTPEYTIQKIPNYPQNYNTYPQFSPPKLNVQAPLRRNSSTNYEQYQQKITSQPNPYQGSYEATTDNQRSFQYTENYQMGTSQSFPIQSTYSNTQTYQTNYQNTQTNANYQNTQTNATYQNTPTNATYQNTPTNATYQNTPTNANYQNTQTNTNYMMDSSYSKASTSNASSNIIKEGDNVINNLESKSECEICKTTFVNASFLEKHMEVHKNAKATRPFKCDFCPKTFQHASNLIGHRKSHTKEKNFKCEICGKMFAQQSHLTAHQRFHTATENVKAHTCQTCQMSFVNAEALQKHEIIHTGQKPYACSICSKAFPLLSSLLKHQHMHSDTKAFKCEVCQKGFAKESTLEIHKRLHTGDRPFQCDVCSKAFFHQTNLSTHMRIHSSECPYKCDICDRSFVKSADLTRHRRTHPTVCPFKCPDCNKSFSNEPDLENHKRIHQEDCPFKCDVCKKAFLKISDLNRHVRIHSGDKPFVCNLCNLSFNRSDSLLKHRRSHGIVNEAKPSFPCETCSKSFAHPNSLAKHIKTHHPNTVPSTSKAESNVVANSNLNTPSISSVSGVNDSVSSCNDVSNLNV